MRSSLVLLVCLPLLLSILLPAMEAAPARRGGRQQGRSKQLGRRGRQDGDADAANPNAVDEAIDGDEAVDGEGEAIYNGCDWRTSIGGFLNFCKFRKWCADNKGITDFGLYGGVPEDCTFVGAAEDGGDAAVDGGDEAEE